VTESGRRGLSWVLAIAALGSAALGFGALAAAASWASVTVPWVAATFLSSVPLAVLGLRVARRPTLQVAPAIVSGAALFVFTAVWLLFLVVKLS